MDIILGILGGFLGGWLFGMVGIHAESSIGGIVVAFVGACILVRITRFIKRA